MAPVTVITKENWLWTNTESQLKKCKWERSQTHHVGQIQSILIIIRRVNRNAKSEIYQGTESYQTNQTQVHPSICGCASGEQGWKLHFRYFCLAKEKHEPNTHLYSHISTDLTKPFGNVFPQNADTQDQSLRKTNAKILPSHEKEQACPGQYVPPASPGCKPKSHGKRTALTVCEILCTLAGGTNHSLTAVQQPVVPPPLWPIPHQTHRLSALPLSGHWLSLPGLPKGTRTNEPTVPVRKCLPVGEEMINF